ncbi:MAG TPA: malate synthase A [Dehalococcoidia bacterium]|nr:malate synthase A [Dehalococcoidia bacterium]
MPGERNYELKGPADGRFAEVLTPDALGFVADLHRRFNATRKDLLARRAERQKRFDAGEKPDFLPETKHIRDDDSWRVAPITTADLQDRRVEITGPTDRRMVINALNCGARVFMADFEDANTPTWHNMIDGHVNLIDAVRRNIRFEREDGRVYELNEKVATLLVRPRGWHLDERHLVVDGEPVSGSLFDFGLYFFHNAKELIDRGSGPYFYLPKMESHLEARLWNDAFTFSEERIGVPHGSIKATVLIETILGAFEIDEILYELRDHSAGCNAGRWDYIFSAIKKFRNWQNTTLPDRGQITMTVPFMRSYTELLVKTCHRRGAFAMGGMAAFIPSRRDADVNATAMARVREDKLREAHDGFDGTWVAHPDLVEVATEVFDEVLGDRPNQISKQRPDVNVTAADLLALDKTGGAITEAGLRQNISVGLQYIESWLRGVGAAAIYNLMEDAATAEISRSQLWQWIHNGAKLDDGREITPELVKQITDEEMAKLPADEPGRRFIEAREVFEKVATADEFEEFLTIPALAFID